LRLDVQKMVRSVICKTKFKTIPLHRNVVKSQHKSQPTKFESSSFSTIQIEM
jgi:hypothetical protein